MPVIDRPRLRGSFVSNVTRSKTRGGRRFEKGNKAAIGNKGGGRPPEWLIAECKKYVEKREIIKFLADVAGGENVREVQSGDGSEVVGAPAEIRDRLKAAEMLLDRGWGKPDQSMDVSGHIKHDIIESIRKAEEERGLDPL